MYEQFDSNVFWTCFKSYYTLKATIVEYKLFLQNNVVIENLKACWDSANNVL